jgi:hypothetical protein
LFINSNIKKGNITHTGISWEEVEGMEERLASDVIEESEQYEDHFLYHTEEEEMVNEMSSLKLVSKWIKLENDQNTKLISKDSKSKNKSSGQKISSTKKSFSNIPKLMINNNQLITSPGIFNKIEEEERLNGEEEEESYFPDFQNCHVMTPKKIFSTAKKYSPFQLSYFRIPVTDEKEMEQKDVDDIINILYSSLKSSNITSHKDVPIFLFNCQMGRGRTTSAMVN